MNFLKTVLLILALALSGTAAARNPEAIINFSDIAASTASGKTLSINELKLVIQTAARVREWMIVNQPDGTMLGTLSWNGDKHSISIEITCTGTSYSLTYKDSINMKYGLLDGQPLIHPYYNRFVRELNNAIRIELSRL